MPSRAAPSSVLGNLLLAVLGDPVGAGLEPRTAECKAFASPGVLFLSLALIHCFVSGIFWMFLNLRRALPEFKLGALDVRDLFMVPTGPWGFSGDALFVVVSGLI